MRNRLIGISILSAILLVHYITASLASGPAWVHTWGGSAGDAVRKIEMDPDGDIYVLFDDESGTFKSSIIKISPDGSTEWDEPIFPGVEQVSDITVDISGNLYITGLFTGSVDFGEGENSVKLTTPSSKTEPFLCKYNANREFQWARMLQSPNSDHIFVDTDEAGNVYCAGSFSDVSYFDPSSETESVDVQGLENYLLKLDENGNYVWSAKTENVGENGSRYMWNLNRDECKSIAVDSIGNSYTTGKAWSRSQPNQLPPRMDSNVENPEGPDISAFRASIARVVFIRKTDPEGIIDWEYTWQTEYDYLAEVATDNFGNIYVLSTFIGQVSFGDGPDAVTYTSSSTATADGLLLKLNPSGSLAWFQQWTVGMEDFAGIDPYGIHVDDTGIVRCVGTYMGSVDFDPGRGVYSRAWDDSFLYTSDTDGNYLGTKTWGYIDLFDVVSSDNENVYVGGEFRKVIDFDPGLEIDKHMPNGPSDALLVKLNSNGGW